MLHGHERAITQIRYNLEGDLLFSVSKDTKPTVWYSANGERLGTYNGHNGAVWCIDVTRIQLNFGWGRGVQVSVTMSTQNHQRNRMYVKPVTDKCVHVFVSSTWLLVRQEVFDLWHSDRKQTRTQTPNPGLLGASPSYNAYLRDWA